MSVSTEEMYFGPSDCTLLMPESEVEGEMSLVLDFEVEVGE